MEWEDVDEFRGRMQSIVGSTVQFHLLKALFFPRKKPT